MKKQDSIRLDETRPKIIFSGYDSLGNIFYNGGGARAIHEVAKRLSKFFSVSIISGKYPGSKDEVIEGVRYTRVGSHVNNGKFSQMAYSLSLPLIARNLEFDLWFESFTPPFSTSFLPLVTSKPVVGLAHSLPGTELSRRYGQLPRLIERYALRLYKRVIAVSDFIKDEILSANQIAEVSVIPNGVVSPTAQKSFAKGDYFLFLGRIDIDQKGLDLLLRSFKRSGAGVTLVIAGNGQAESEARLRLMLQKLNLLEKTELLGRVEGKLKDELIENALAVAVPSRFEAFSLTALEAMSHGKPVVCFDIRGLAWIPDSASIKVKPFDEKAFSDALKLLATDYSLRCSLGDEGRKIAATYSWDRVAESYITYVYSLLPYYQGRQSVLLKQAVNRIRKDKAPVYFISPHLDDAVLSAGGLISALSSSVKVYVVSVFTRPDNGASTLSAKRFLSICGYKDKESLFADRRLEDRLACERLGAEPVHLGFIDALWRKKNYNNVYSSVLGKIFPSFVHRYPTYRWHVVSGKLHPEDLSTLKEQLKISIKLVVPDNAYVFCPAGCGEHADHLLVKLACEEIFDRPAYWLDYPYSLKSGPITMAERNKAAWFENSSRKLEAIRGYKTQLKGLFPHGVIKFLPEIFYL